MGSFAGQVGLVALILAALFGLVATLARPRGQHATIRSFAIAAVVVLVVCIALVASSGRLVDQCLAAGNLDCSDRGSAGMQALFVGGYSVVALTRSYFLWKD